MKARAKKLGSPGSQVSKNSVARVFAKSLDFRCPRDRSGPGPGELLVAGSSPAGGTLGRTFSKIFENFKFFQNGPKRVGSDRMGRETAWKRIFRVVSAFRGVGFMV